MVCQHYFFHNALQRYAIILTELALVNVGQILKYGTGEISNTLW